VSVAYLDTSALIKQYVAEVGSHWTKALLVADRTPTVFTSRMTLVEATCAFARRQRDGTLSPEEHVQVLTAFEYDIQYRYNLVQQSSISPGNWPTDIHYGRTMRYTWPPLGWQIGS
jgi:predicted nucleic acid-binding protein